MKTYRKSYSINDVNKITPNDNGPQYIHYTGVFDPVTQAFSGTWTIDATYFFKDGTQKNVVSTGTWEMRRRVL